MKRLISIAFILVAGFASAQDSIRYEWKEYRAYHIRESEVWCVDGLENIYISISSKSVIQKADSVGQLKFTQSIKSLGKMTDFKAINTMKLVHFSEDQQTLCYFDNTLTANDDCIELIDHDIYYASMIATSTRPDMIWIYDNVNSSLRLLHLEGDKQQGVEINNLKGVLGLENIVDIVERYNHLYILDADKGLYIFDMYGSLIDQIPIENALAVDANDKAIFLLADDKLVSYTIKGLVKQEFKLPIDEIADFSLTNQSFFFEASRNVHKYRLQISK